MRFGIQIAAAALAVLSPVSAAAHGAEGGIVLLLPTGYYILGAAIAVAATFLLLSALPDRWSLGLHRPETSALILRLPSPHLTSMVSAVVLAGMVAAGLLGSRDPLLNPLPAYVWTVFWVCLTLAHGLFGPLWTAVNPWTGPISVLRRATGAFRTPVARLPDGLGYAVSLLQFYGFAWFELVDLAPEDPQRLAVAVGLYWVFNLLAMLVFGEAEWMRRAEPFSIFFRLLGQISPLAYESRPDGRLAASFGWPGRQLLREAPLSASGVLFVLLTLSTVSFDGLSSTFVWLSTVGINPLEFPGRSAVTGSSTVGLVAVFVAFALLFHGSLVVGGLLSGERRFGEMAGRLVYGILPISLAFQFAHYLTLVLVEAQNFAKAVSDPFALGWDLFGTRDLHVTASFLADFDSVEMIFNAQTAAIALGHILAVILAHALVVQMSAGRRRPFLFELPFALLMVFYTAFGLWLLATPRI